MTEIEKTTFKYVQYIDYVREEERTYNKYESEAVICIWLFKMKRTNQKQEKH
jgi:hypothetical protein